jgi:lipopolysaccharide export system protein LptC
LSSEYYIPDEVDEAPAPKPAAPATPARETTPASGAPDNSLLYGMTLRTGEAYEAHRSRVLRSAASYSRVVRALKLLLPLSALMLVAAAVLFVMFYDADDTLTLSFTSVEHLDNDLRMVNPRFRGMDNERRPFLVTATSAIQDVRDPRNVTLENLQADMALSETSWVGLSADSGHLDSEEQTLELEGNISVFTDAGYEFHTQRALVQLEEQRVTSNTEVTGQGPLGTMRADGFVAEEAGDRLRFTGNVRMRIYPPGS